MMDRVPMLAIICAALLVTLSGAAQNAPPVNDRPNPYALVGNWPQLPEGRTLGAVSGVDIDRDGSSVWIADRCGGNSCADSTVAPILKFDAQGRLVKAFGAGLFAIPHGVHVDREGNIWVTDDSITPAPGKGHQVIKFDPDGKVLLTLGKPGVPGHRPRHLQPPIRRCRRAERRYLRGRRSWRQLERANRKVFKERSLSRDLGQEGYGPGRVRYTSRLGDGLARPTVRRGSPQLPCADLRAGRPVRRRMAAVRDAWRHLHRRPRQIYVADSLSSPQTNAGWIRGIRIGNARDGAVSAFIPDATPEANPITAAEGVAVDAQGNIYGAVVPTPGLLRYVRK